MRLPVLIAAGAAGIAAGVVPALAAGELRSATTHPVAAQHFAFSPATVEIAVGDTVKWTEGGGEQHTVKFGSQEHDINDSTGFSRTFDADATVSYVCGLHPSMNGTVEVGTGGTTTGTTSTGTTTTQTTTTQTTTTGTTTTPTTTTGTTTTTTTGTTTAPAGDVVALDARPTRSSFCVRRSAACRKPGIAIRLTADAGTVRGVLRRVGARKAFGTVRLRVRSGTQVVRFTTVAGRRPPRGRYRLALRHEGWPSSVPAETVRFRVR